MTAVVFDCGVLLSAIGWSGNPRRCLVLAAHRQIKVAATTGIWSEYERIIPTVLATKRPMVNPAPMLHWLLSITNIVEPAPLGKPRSRDPKDDPYLACAIAARAQFLVSNDRDLLDLGKPFGVQMVTPLQLLIHVRERSR